MLNEIDNIELYTFVFVRSLVNNVDVLMLDKYIDNYKYRKARCTFIYNLVLIWLTKKISNSEVQKLW